MKLKHENHPKPVTRRQFLSQGMIAGASYVMIPNLVNLLMKPLLADEIRCPGPVTASSMIPFIYFDCAGGTPLTTEFVIGGRSGQLDLLTNYENYGIPNNLRYGNGVTPDTTYGVAFHPNSAMLMGLNSVISTQFRSNIDGVVFAGTSNDDTSNNTHSPSYLISEAGRTGSLIASVGTSTSVSGVNAQPATGSNINASFRPAQTTNRNQAQGLVNPGRLVAILGATGKADKVRNFISQMSSQQLQAFSNLNYTAQVQTLVDCGYVNASQLLASFSPDQIFPNNPAANDPLVTVFGATPQNSRTATVARLVLNDYAGNGGVEIGDCDRHNNNAADYRQKNFEIGQEVGKVIQYANLLNKPVVVCIYTDGGMGITRNAGVAATDNTVTNGNTLGGDGFIARPGDNGSVSGALMLISMPGATRGNIVYPARQVGAYTNAGVDQSYLITAANTTNMSKAMVYNYLGLHGLESRFANLPGNNGTDPFAGRDQSKYLMTKKIT